MAQLPCHIHFTPAYTGFLRIIARPRRNLSIVAADEVFEYFSAVDQKESIYVPTPEIHQVTMYKTPDGVALGVQVYQADLKPEFYNGRFLPDLDLEVGRNTAEDPENPGVIIDPVPGTTEVAIPFLEGKEVARIFRAGALRPMRPFEYSLTTSLGAAGIRLLVTDDVFSLGDVFRVEMAPFYETNTGQAIFDLTELLTDHIGDTENPHGVTKDQVGLGNLPNETSNSYTDNNAGKLATAQAVYNLAQTINNLIIKVDRAVIGNIGNVTGGGQVVNVFNESGTDTKVTIQHNLNISGPYTVICQIEGPGAQWNQNNDVIVMLGQSRSPNEFDLAFRKVSPNTTSVNVWYMIVKA